MDETKTLAYQWELGTEEIDLGVGVYHYGNNLAVLMYSEEEGEMESFGDLTVNLPGYSLEPNEAFIDGFDSKSKLAFIRQHKLGKVQSWKGRSGYCAYAVVAFDLTRLSQFDKEGVERFCRLHGMELPKERKTGKKRTGKER